MHGCKFAIPMALHAIAIEVAVTHNPHTPQKLPQLHTILTYTACIFSLSSRQSRPIQSNRMALCASILARALALAERWSPRLLVAT